MELVQSPENLYHLPAVGCRFRVTMELFDETLKEFYSELAMDRPIPSEI